MKIVIAVVFTLLATLFVTMEQVHAFNCQEAKVSWLPCVGYLIGGGGPSTSCCNAIKSLKSSLGTKDDRLTACECFKDAVNLFSNINEDLLASLPKRCDVEIRIPLSKNMKCSNIPFGQHNREINVIKGI
ncbi:non-specific lipid-transfer protein 1-like [Lotus japonicus]|uniref:non-specific lipid-transfer protein 1-like n=1 Tax=Lotus japonicus TaxID=34305 RepID=UPI00258990AD|nr:non-specific lipid-transfer protein 1-like [Lotus japonicus]XP_057427204.1 non-specific lipid-transfer protein 1-like [Lotus japonicus]